MTKATSTTSVTLSYVVKLVAKPHTVDAVSEFLTNAVDLAAAEETTITWFALRTDETTFWVFDSFENEEGRRRHISGPIAEALLASADELFAVAPEILPADILSVKLPG